MDNNEAELKGVLAIKVQSFPGFWMVLPISDINCLEELGSLLKIQSVNEISFWTMQSFSVPKNHIAQQAETVQGQRLFLSSDQYILGFIHSSY